MRTSRALSHAVRLGLIAVACFIADVDRAAAAGTSNSAEAPVVDGEEIANYGPVTWTDKWWAESSSAAGRPHGQTISIGDSGVMLKAISYQVAQHQKADPTREYVLRVGEVDVAGATFTEIHRETAVQDFTWHGGEFMTWTLDEPVYLAPNASYGVDILLASGSTSWRTGIPYLNGTEDIYPGGTSYLSGSVGDDIGEDALSSMGRDRVFHVDLENPMAPRPFDAQVVPGGEVELSWRNAVDDLRTDHRFSAPREPVDESGGGWSKGHCGTCRRRDLDQLIGSVIDAPKDTWAIA